MKNIFSEEQAETALCLWEAIMVHPDYSPSDQAEFFGCEGAVAFRLFVLNELAPLVDQAYEQVSDDYHEPFDWEFCPMVLGLVIDFRRKHDFLPGGNILVNHIREVGSCG
jgi:hypothetical protein